MPRSESEHVTIVVVEPVEVWKHGGKGEEVYTAPCCSAGPSSDSSDSAGSDGMAPLPVTLSWPGCGVLMFWQLGVLKALSRHLDVSRIPMLGSSSGALVTALSACNVDIDTATDSVLRLLDQHGVCNRRIGVVGVLGAITRDWLGEVLPEDAGARCSRHSTMLITRLPHLTTEYIGSFASKQDVVDCALASAHLPLLLDWTWWAVHKEMPCIDGGFWWWVNRSELEYRQHTATVRAKRQRGPPPAPSSRDGGFVAAAQAAGAAVIMEAGQAQAAAAAAAHGGGQAHPVAHQALPRDAFLIIKPSDDAQLLQEWHVFRRLRPGNLVAAHELVAKGEAYAERELVQRLLAAARGEGLGLGLGAAAAHAQAAAAAGGPRLPSALLAAGGVALAGRAGMAGRPSVV